MVKNKQHTKLLGWISMSHFPELYHLYLRNTEILLWKIKEYLEVNHEWKRSVFKGSCDLTSQRIHENSTNAGLLVIDLTVFGGTVCEITGFLIYINHHGNL